VPSFSFSGDMFGGALQVVLHLIDKDVKRFIAHGNGVSGAAVSYL